MEQVTAKFRLAFAANYFTKSAVEMALWDIAGKVATSRSRCQLWQAWPSQTTYLDLVSNSTTKRSPNIAWLESVCFPIQQSRSLKSQYLRPFPSGLAAFPCEIDPIVFP